MAVAPHSVDVAVVGLGPAGASAARVIADAGYRVIAIDRKQRPGQPVQCAEFVPAMLGYDSPSLAEASYQSITSMRSFVEDQNADLTPHFRGRMIDRGAFDALLTAQAQDAGADCRFGIALSDVTTDGDLVFNDGTSIQTRMIIGADGPRSVVGAAVGIQNHDLVETRQITVPLLKPLEATDIFLRAEIAGGYGWLFPKGDMANLGLGVDPNFRGRLKPLLEEIHKDLVAQGRLGEEVFYHTGGAIPVGGLQGCYGYLGEVPVMMVGDAAGLTNPITGAGIPAAVLSGEMAGEAAAAWLSGEAEALSYYEEDIRELFDASLKRASARRREILKTYNDDQQPDANALRRSWIAYDEYWAA